MSTGSDPGPYYRADLALVHDRGFGFHADACAPGVLALLQPVLERGGLVLELGCGSGLLTRYLVEAGHRVLATDASPAMLDLARTTVPGVTFERLTLPDDPVPAADAVVGVGHALNYLPDAPALRRGLLAAARALRPGGVLALDVCDLRWGVARQGEPDRSWVEEDWALVTRFSQPCAGQLRARDDHVRAVRGRHLAPGRRAARQRPGGHRDVATAAASDRHGRRSPGRVRHRAAARRAGRARRPSDPADRVPGRSVLHDRSVLLQKFRKIDSDSS